MTTTLAGIGLLALAVLLILFTRIPPTAALAPAIAVLSVNLATAIFVKDSIRSSTALLVFHIALLAIMLLAGVSRLTYLRGWIQLANGENFDKLSGIISQGPWHSGSTRGLQLTQGPFEIWVTNRHRAKTLSRVIENIDGPKPKRFIIDDRLGLYRRGYYLTLSENHGFAPMFYWRRNGKSVPGVVQLPSYPGNRYSQALSWTLPGTDNEIWTQLQFEEDVVRDGRFVTPQRHRLVIRQGEARYEMAPGDSLSLGGGLLTYVELKQWIGYDVFYDRTIPWLLGSCLTAVLGLGVVLYQKWRRQPWLTPDEETK